MSTKFQIRVKETKDCHLAPRSTLYRTLDEAQATAARDMPKASLVVINSVTPGQASEFWWKQAGQAEWTHQPAGRAAEASVLVESAH